MKPGRVPIAILAAACLLLPLHARQERNVVEHIAILGPDAKPLADVAATSVSLQVDGIARPLQSLIQATLPLALVILVDTSFSNATLAMGTGLADAQYAIERAVGTLGPADRVYVGAVSATITALEPLSNDRNRIKKAVRALESVTDTERAGPSPLWDAVWAATTALGSGAGRRHVVLISDGQASGNVHGQLETLKRAMLSDVTLHAYLQGREQMLSQGDQLLAAVRPGVLLEQFTRESGGVMFRERSHSAPGGKGLHLQQSLESLFADLRAQYQLTFAMPDDASFHRLAISSRTPGVSVRHRTARVAGPGAAAR